MCLVLKILQKIHPVVKGHKENVRISSEKREEFMV
jgi:hypothetical protein